MYLNQNGIVFVFCIEYKHVISFLPVCISNGNLVHFRPPSGQTLQDDTWLRPASKAI